MQNRFVVSKHDNRIAAPGRLKRFVAAIAITAAMLSLSAAKSFAQADSAQTAAEHAVQPQGHKVHIFPFQPKHGVDKTQGHQAPGATSVIPNFSSPAGAHLTYYGGPVVSNIQVVVVNYGSGSYLAQLATTLPQFYTAITNGTFMDLLSEYYTVGRGGSNQQIQHGTYAGTFDITPSSANNGSTIDDTQIQSEIIAQINAGHLPAPTYDAGGNANTLYMVYFPHGKTITQGGTSSCVAGGFCAYHGTISNLGRDVLYGVQPDMQSGSGCDTGCGNNTAINNYTSVGSHEFAETITDAAVGLATTTAAPLAWYDNTNGEIGDICNAQQGTADGFTVQAEFSNLQGNCVVGPVSFVVGSPATATAGTSISVPVTARNSTGANTGQGYVGTVHFTSSDPAATLPADYTYVVGDNGTHTFNVTLNTAGTQTINVTDALATGFKGSANVSVSGAVANDFSISAAPSSVSVQQGSSGNSTISTAVTSGSAGTVSLSISGMPVGATASFNPTSVTAGSSSTLTLNTGTAATGTYTVTVTGTEGSTSHTTNITFTITAPATNDFSISASPASLSILQGNSGSSTISTAVTAGSAGTVSLSVSGVPSGATASLSPTSVTAGGSSTLSVNAGTAAAGNYTLTVTGTEGTASHSTSVSLTVSAISPPPNGIVNGGFETGNLTGWTAAGASTGVVTGGHSGTYAARLGSTSPTNGDSTIAQTFVAPSGTNVLTLWYKMTCPDTLTYDWASVSLKDNTANTTANVLPKTCTTNSWTQLSASLTAGHSYTLTLLSHDDNYSADPTYTLYDDVAISSSAPPPSGITNGGFETGNLSGWTSTGAAATVVSSGAHSGTYAARLGSTTPTNGDSNIAQTFSAPAGSTSLTFWYKMTCPDTVVYDWATATLRDNTAGTTATVLAKVCTTNAWTQKSATITAGHSYTLTLTSHDDNYSADPSYTLYDDVATH